MQGRLLFRGSVLKTSVWRHGLHAAADHRGGDAGPRPPINREAALTATRRRSATTACRCRPGCHSFRIALARPVPPADPMSDYEEPTGPHRRRDSLARSTTPGADRHRADDHLPGAHGS